MKPSRLLLQLLLVWLSLGLLAAAATLLGWPREFEIKLLFWSWLLLLAVIALLDGYSLRRPQLEATRLLEPHLALGVQQHVEIRLVNRDRRPLRLWLTDFAPARLHCEGLPVRLELEPNAQARVRYSITPLQRGLAEFGQVCCRVTSGWKLWEKNYYYGEPQQSRIYPNYKPLFRSSFVGSDQLYADLGMQLRQRRGEGTDFHQLRDFRIGDSLRQVDWRATARFQKPISREYQEERDQQVVFLLDCGRRMRARDGEISHFDHALNALLISAFVALRQGDSVGLLSFAGQSRWVAPIKGRFQISRLLDQIYDLDSTHATSDFLDVAQQLMTRQPRRSLVVLISSLEPQDREDLASAARLLSRHHLVMVASMRQQVLTDTLAAEVVSFEDALKYCGVTHHLQQQAAMYAQLRSDHIIVADTPPSHMHSTLINEYMALKRSGVF
ncbi:MAG: DUF58 domain-containing protein [Gammaproteobacteria bacterium]|nr:DUF58 domain-containing protein [Gammaproteobacteria bacterium]MDH3450337.1 DUF58 domain-containing protein [Gammaproteobacteria bacterium]